MSAGFLVHFGILPVRVCELACVAGDRSATLFLTMCRSIPSWSMKWSSFFQCLREKFRFFCHPCFFLFLWASGTLAGALPCYCSLVSWLRKRWLLGLFWLCGCHDWVFIESWLLRSCVVHLLSCVETGTCSGLTHPSCLVFLGWFL